MKRTIRTTKETKVEVRLAAARSGGGLGEVTVETGLPFFDHMVTTFLRYAGLDAKVKAEGDLHHHLMEDVAITLGRGVRGVLPAAARRYGERTIPMDDALVQACIDVGGRFYFAGELPNRLYSHVLRSFAHSLGATLHVRILAGTDRHHIIEAAYKATGLALAEAMQALAGGGVFSLKGSETIVEDDVEDA